MIIHSIMSFLSNIEHSDAPYAKQRTLCSLTTLYCNYYSKLPYTAYNKMSVCQCLVQWQRAVQTHLVNHQNVMVERKPAVVSGQGF